MQEQTVNMVKPFLENDLQFLQRTLPDFLAQLQSFLEDPAAAVTGLRLCNLSDQALALSRTFGQIGNLLARPDNQATAHDLEPLDRVEQLPADYQAQAGDYYLVSVYAGRSVVMCSDGLGRSWKYMAELKTPEAHHLVAPMTPLGKKGGFLFYRSAPVAEQEDQYPKSQPRSHMIHEARENAE